MSTQNESNWYEFTAYNSEAIYGYGTEAEAAEYCERLNKDRDINVYSYDVAPGSDEDYCDHWNNLEDELSA